jgi:magnesium-transporting ATPase (P-type)
MRFGKTFTAYQLAKKLKANRVLVVTFKPAVEDAWQTDLENHKDFDGWQYLSRSTGGDPTQIDNKQPVVYFGSFQDLLGRDAEGNIKVKNEWLHVINWDLVVFDEYHFGAWRESAKDLFAFDKATEDLVVLARSTPENKYQLVTGLKELGNIVAVTGLIYKLINM